jgi:hypothetical protein
MAAEVRCAEHQRSARHRVVCRVRPTFELTPDRCADEVPLRFDTASAPDTNHYVSADMGTTRDQ